MMLLLLLVGYLSVWLHLSMYPEIRTSAWLKYYFALAL